MFEPLSDTPRTDAFYLKACEPYIGEWMAHSPTEGKAWSFARQLERELAQAREDALEEAAKVCSSRLGSPGNFTGTPDEIRDREAEEIEREIRALKNNAAQAAQKRREDE